MPDVTDVWTLLQGRRRSDGGLPLVTSVDAASGERTELSTASTENAAAKIANALRDEYGLEPGAVVGVHLPVHWQRSTWCAGIWTAGCVVAPWATDADLVVATAPTAAAVAGRATAPIAVVSLHPFGLPITEPLPAGCTDATITVRQQPDAYLYAPPAPTDAALLVEQGTLDQADLLALARRRGDDWGLAPGGRLMADDAVTGTDAWLAALAVPLACQAAVVLVSGAADLDRVTAQERVTARARS